MSLIWVIILMSQIQLEHNGRRLFVNIKLLPPDSEDVARLPVSEVDSKDVFTYGAIFDTGCTCTSISKNVVRDLGLVSYSKVPVAGITGTVLKNVYSCRFGFEEDKGHINIHHQPIECMEFDNSGFDIDVLIGMDVITMGELTVHRYPAFTFKY